MRKLTVLLFLLGLSSGVVNGQLRIGAEHEFINTSAYLTRIPDMPVEDAAGNKYTLKNYILQNQLHPGKPILVITWYTFCGGCRRHVETMAKEGFGDKYNVVTILLKIGSRGPRDDIELDPIFGNGSKETDWHKFLNLVSNDSLASEYLYNGASTPLYIFADKNMNIHSAYVSLDMGMVKSAGRIMEQLENFKGTFKPGMRWFDEEGMPVPAGAADAVRYTHTYPKGKLVMHTKLSTRDSSRVIEQYINGKNVYLADGVWESYDETGKLIEKNVYRLGGITETVRSTHPNGKVSSIIPPDGIAKTFDENGKLTMEGPMKNGLGEGVFKLYENGVLSAEITLSGGRYHGPYKVYKDGEVDSVTHYKDGKEVIK